MKLYLRRNILRNTFFAASLCKLSSITEEVYHVTVLLQVRTVIKESGLCIFPNLCLLVTMLSEKGDRHIPVDRIFFQVNWLPIPLTYVSENS
jgi:hypothetical protein